MNYQEMLQTMIKIITFKLRDAVDNQDWLLVEEYIQNRTELMAMLELEQINQELIF